MSQFGGPMLKKLLTTATVLGAAITLATAAAAQDAPPGTVVIGPPTDVVLDVTTGPGGEPVLGADEFLLNLGGYYRFNFSCLDARDDTTGFHFESPDLMANMHLRVISVGDMEIYAQGLSFRALECDETGAIRFSFHPMRRGVYDFLVRDHSDPPKEAYGRFVVE